MLSPFFRTHSFRLGKMPYDDASGSDAARCSAAGLLTVHWLSSAPSTAISSAPPAQLSAGTGSCAFAVLGGTSTSLSMAHAMAGPSVLLVALVSLFRRFSPDMSASAELRVLVASVSIPLRFSERASELLASVCLGLDQPMSTDDSVFCDGPGHDWEGGGAWVEEVRGGGSMNFQWGRSLASNPTTENLCIPLQGGVGDCDQGGSNPIAKVCGKLQKKIAVFLPNFTKSKSFYQNENLILVKRLLLAKIFGENFREIAKNCGKLRKIANRNPPPPNPA